MVQLLGKAKSEAQAVYLSYVKKLTWYGSTIFTVQHIAGNYNSEMSSIYVIFPKDKNLQVDMAINVDGIHFLSTKTKVIQTL
jgi:hypothetical protein